MRKGQSITEYALALGLVGIVALGSVAVLGNGIQVGVNSLIPGQSSLKPPAGILPATVPAVSEAPKGGNLVSDTFPSSTLHGNTVCLNGAICVQIPEISGGAAETDGSLGGKSTHKFASILDQLASELQGISPSDPSLVALIRKVALQGHTLGNYQTEMANLCGSGCDSSRESAMKDSYKSYKGQIEFFEQYRHELEDYLGDNHNASLQNLPAVQSVINDATKTISGIARGVKWDERDEETGNKAQITHTNANTICAQGGDGCYQSVDGNSEEASVSGASSI